MKAAGLIASAALVLAACATSPGAMEQPENAASFTLPQPYQLTLKRIVEADEECRPLQLVPIGQVINDVNDYPSLREAKIVQGSSGIGRQINQVTVVREPASGGTEVVVYAKTLRDRRLARLRRWATGDPACDL